MVEDEICIDRSISPSAWKDVGVEVNNYHGFQFFDETSDAWPPGQASAISYC